MVIRHRTEARHLLQVAREHGCSSRTSWPSYTACWPSVLPTGPDRLPLCIAREAQRASGRRGARGPARRGCPGRGRSPRCGTTPASPRVSSTSAGSGAATRPCRAPDRRSRRRRPGKVARRPRAISVSSASSRCSQNARTRGARRRPRPSDRASIAYRRREPSARTSAKPASRSTRSCIDTAGCRIPNSARSPRSPRPRSARPRQQLEDPAAHGVAEDVEGLHRGTLRGGGVGGQAAPRRRRGIRVGAGREPARPTRRWIRSSPRQVSRGPPVRQQPGLDRPGRGLEVLGSPIIIISQPIPTAPGPNSSHIPGSTGAECSSLSRVASSTSSR